MARPQRPRITPIAGPILGEFLVGISVTMAALWMASQISDAAADRLLVDGHDIVLPGPRQGSSLLAVSIGRDLT